MYAGTRTVSDHTEIKVVSYAASGINLYRMVSFQNQKCSVSDWLAFPVELDLHHPGTYGVDGVDGALNMFYVPIQSYNTEENQLLRNWDLAHNQLRCRTSLPTGDMIETSGFLIAVNKLSIHWELGWTFYKQMGKQQWGLIKPHLKHIEMTIRAQTGATAEWTELHAHSFKVNNQHHLSRFVVWCSVTLSISLEACCTLLGVYVPLSTTNKHVSAPQTSVICFVKLCKSKWWGEEGTAEPG